MASTRKPKSINLALQGGGSHGAFTWGILDRLLADDRLEIAAISGTSAGAMNAEWKFLTHLRDIGRETAEAWLEEHYACIGREDSIDIRALFQGIGVRAAG